MFGVGIIGLGHVAIHHIAALEHSSDFRLLAGCDPEPSKHEMLGKSVVAYSDHRDMLEREDLHVIVVASPNRLHIEHGIDAMSAGRWVFMEKPLARSRDDFDRFDRRKRELGGYCSQALHAAHGPEVEWLLANGHAGDANIANLESFSAEFCDPYMNGGQVIPHGPTAWGAWMDSGINALSVVCRLFGADHARVTDCRMIRDRGSNPIPIDARVDVEFSGPDTIRRGTINTNWTKAVDNKVTAFRLHDSPGTLVVDHSQQSVSLRNAGRERMLFACDNGLPRLTNHYIGAFGDLAGQLAAGADNFEYSRKLHALVFDAEYWED